MASGELQPNRINEEQIANEIYNGLMDITKKEVFKDNEIADNNKERNNAGYPEDQEGEKAVKTNRGKGFDGSGFIEATAVQSSTEETTEVNNEGELSQRDKTPDQSDGKVNRLSKAVHELSDLEEQLISMISESSKQLTQQDNDSVTPCVTGNDNAINNGTNKEEKTVTTEGKKQPSTDGIEISTEIGLIEHHATEDAKAPPHASEAAAIINGTEITKGSKDLDIEGITTDESHFKEDGAKNIGNKEIITAECNEDEFKENSSEKIHTDENKAKDEETTDVFKPHPREEPQHDDTGSSNVLANKNSPINISCTVAQQQCDTDNFEQENVNAAETLQDGFEKEKSDENTDTADVPEAQDFKDKGKCSSVPDIEVLMTDESGISERKSLDSLDSLDENPHSRSDSPALSDEGIDSDSKSDVGDDDAFDTIANSLEVDRNRIGSDSLTLSEQQFIRDLPDKTDGLNGETLVRVCMQGYLLKLGGSGLTPRNWRRRWFILKSDNCLYYYKHSKDKVPCGVIILCNYSITKAPEYSRKCCFKFNKGGARSYYFCASNEDEMREWMVALMAAATEATPERSSFQISEGSVHNVSIPALSIKDPECHGYLSKQGHNFKNWKRRYCVLKNGYLYYYSDMSNTTALGVAKLLDYSIKPGEKRGKHYCFYGSPPDDSLRTFHFAAETEKDRESFN